MNLKQIEQNLYQAIGKRKEIESNLSQKKILLNECILLSPFLDTTQALIQETARETQEQLRFHLEDIIQTGLETCFPETYNAYVNFENKRGKTECDIFLKNRNGKRVDPLDSNGGGLVDLVSFSLRIACWVISSSAPVLFFDEPFKWMDVGLKPVAGELFRSLIKKLDIQVLMVTHDEEMKEIADKIFEVKLNNNKSIVKEKLVYESI